MREFLLELSAAAQEVRERNLDLHTQPVVIASFAERLLEQRPSGDKVIGSHLGQLEQGTRSQ